MSSRKISKKLFSWHAAALLFAAAILVAVGLIVLNNTAKASPISISHTPSSGVISTATNHTFTFTIVNAIPADGFITVYFSDGYTFQTGIDYTDVDFIVNGSQRGLAASSSSVSDGISFSGYLMRIRINNIIGVSAGAQIEIRIGTNATDAQTGDKQVVKPSSAGTGSLNIETNTPISAGMSLLDSGAATMSITNPPAVNLAETSGSTAVSESGSPDTYYISLNSQPSANVTVSISGGTQLTTSPASLTFTSSNWSQQQSVWIWAVNDSIIEGAHTGTLSHTVSSSDGNYNGIAVNNLTVSISDNDTAGVTITQSGGSTVITEGGATDTYTVVLVSQPSANVTVTPASGAQSSVLPTSLVFTSANWNAAQTVTVTAVDDSVIEGSHSENITHAATSSDTNYNGIAVGSVTATITDNDSAGASIVQSGGATAVTEGGATDTYTVVLTIQPSANVTITPTPDAQLSVSPASLTFTSANWNTAQTVTVTAANDSVVEGNHNGTVTHSASSTDANFNGMTINSVTAAVTDNDTAGVTITETNSTTTATEGGATDTYTVVLTSQPTANVTITGTSSSQLSLSPLTLTFTAANWNTAQTVTVTAVDDSSVEGVHSGTITSTSSSTDANYNGISIAGLSVSITDNDSAATPASHSSASGSGGGGGGGGGGGSSETTPIAVPVAAPETPKETKETEDDTLFADFPGTKIKLSQKTVDNILSILQKMKDDKIYKVPKSKKLNPRSRTKRYFSTQIALALAGKTCGISNTPKACLKAAIDHGVVDKNEIPKIKINRADYFDMLLKAKKIPLVTKKQIPKKICSNVTSKSSDAELVATLRAHGVFSPEKDGSCKTKIGMTKLKALIYATKISGISGEDIKKVQNTKSLEF